MNYNKEKKLIPEFRFPEFQKLEGWEEKKFNDVCKFIRGPFGGALKKEIFVSEGYAVYEQSHAIYGDFTKFRYFISEEKFNELKRFSVLPNDIIMSCSGTMGKFAIVPEKLKEGVINQALLKLTVKSGYEVNFIKSTLELPVNQNKLLSQSAGGAIKNVVEVAQIKEIPLLIPSIKEQNKIAACISSLNEFISLVSERIITLKNYKKGLLQNLFPQEGETVPKFRFKEFSKSWKKVKLKDVSLYFNGGSYENDVKEEGQYELITLKSINTNGQLVSSQRFIDIKVPTLTKGTLVMILSEQAPGLLGMTAIIPTDNKYVLNQRVAEIRPNKEVESYFLSMAINRNQAYFSKHGAGMKVQNISKPNVEKYEFLIPDILEQQKIVSSLSPLDELISAQNKKMEALQIHKKGLLQGLFPNLNEVTA